MDWGLLIATIVAAIVAIISAVLARGQARRAALDRKRAVSAELAAARARDEVRDLVQTATERFEQQAAAIEAAAAAALAPPPDREGAPVPKRQPTFALHQTSKQAFRILNTGIPLDDVVLKNITGRVAVDDPQPHRLDLGDSVRFSVPRLRTEPLRVALVGTYAAADGTPTPFSAEFEV